MSEKQTLHAQLVYQFYQLPVPVRTPVSQDFHIKLIDGEFDAAEQMLNELRGS